MKKIPTILPEYRMNNGDLPDYAWPGGYPVFYIADDGETFCPECVNTENSIHDDLPNDGWGIVGWGINWEDDFLLCCNCNKRIESAYGEREGKQVTHDTASL